MKKIVLIADIKLRVRRDDELKLSIAKANDVKVDTVNRWLREDEEILTTARNLSLIRVGLKIEDSEVITQEMEPEKVG